MRFYTSAVQSRDKILLREVNQGQRQQSNVVYKPTLYTVVAGDAEYHTVDGEGVRPWTYDTMSQAKEALKLTPKPHGMERWVYSFLNETYPGKMEYDFDSIVTAILDIEVASDVGIPDTELADKPMTAISLKTRDALHTFGMVPHVPTEADVVYHMCTDEAAMLRQFLLVWQEINPDIVTGWNTDSFDIPYTINRIVKLLGRKYALGLSPWRDFTPRKLRQKPAGATGTWPADSEKEIETPTGVALLDYMRLFKNKNLVPAPYESYSLNNICSVELGEAKLDYSEYESLLDLYRRDHDKFILYNQRDVRLVEKLEKKRGLIAMVIAMAYRAKVNFEDVLASSRPWDAMTHNYLLDKKIVVPSSSKGTKTRSLLGGFVKKIDNDTPGGSRPGLYRWVMGFDVESEYPNTIIGCNISADTFIGQIPELADLNEIMADGGDYVSLTKWLKGLLDGRLNDFRDFVEKNDAIITANGCLYSRSKRGFLPELLDQFFQERQVFKQISLEASKALTSERDLDRRRELEIEASRYGTLQMGAKVSLNAAYGCLSNEYYRWFNIDHAESVTSTGQLTVKWGERAINQYLNGVLGTSDVDYVIAIDTDSVYVHFGPLVDKVFGPNPDPTKVVEFLDNVSREKIQPLLSSAFDELTRYLNAPVTRIRMKRESICDVAIWVAAKNYILNIHDEEGVKYADPKIKVVGIKAVKPSTPESCRKKISQALKLALTGNEKALGQFIEDFRDEFNSLPFEQVAFPRSIQNVERYMSDRGLSAPGTPIHVRGAILYNYLLEKHGIKTLSPIYDGDKIRFCYLQVPNPTMEHVVSAPHGLPKQFDLDKYIDRKVMFEKAFLNPLNDILAAMGWTANKEVSSLEEFFS